MADLPAALPAALAGPCSVALKVGRTYFWCSCGRSRRQPFCDGSHAGTAFTPLRFAPSADHSAVLCGCKRTAAGPFCDCSPNEHA
ncbi:MAG TPA: CDGSH iron-sulfur domain-containing protein [Steroidobacteraceae bacterium]|nr:CDGSH iron-sulfur domain-containing protein [Steroidobacteraceae bacterium]